MSATTRAARPLRIGVRIPACGRLDAVADAVALAERLGFDSAWLPDSQLIWRDTWMALTLAATRTRRITLGTAVTNVVTRHVSVIASATRTLQELAPGRVVLGLGVGWSSAGMVGLPTTGSRDFATAVGALRTLLAGDSVMFGDTRGELRDAAGPCPIYLGTQGPRNLALAGEVADGIILTMTLPGALVAKKLEHLWSGAATAGRPRSAFDVVVWAPVHVTRDRERDLKRFKPTVAIALRNQPADELAVAGIFERLKGEVPAGIEPDGTHVADFEAAVKACDPLVSDDIARRWVDAFALAGSPAEIQARLRGLAAQGITTLVVTPLAADSNQTLPTALMKDLSVALALDPADMTS